MTDSGRRTPLLLFLLACVLYAGSLGHGWHFDDFHGIVDNPHIRSLAQIPAFFGDPGAFSVNPESAMYRPLLLTTYALDHALYGDSPAGYHAINVLLHGLAGMLVWRLIGLLGGNAWIASVTALLFVAHPVHSEAVNYISSRSELLVSVFILGALVLHLRTGGTSGGWRRALVPLAAVGSVLSKSVAVVLPGLLALADLLRGGRRRLVRGAGTVGLCAVLSVGYVLFVRDLASRALLEAPVRAATAQLWTQAKAHVFYLQLLAMPVRLNVEHQFSVAREPVAAVLLAALFLGSLLVLVAALLRRLPWAGFAVGWWTLTLLPATVVPLIVLVNEHRLYLASVGLLLVVALCLGRLPRRAGVATLAVGAYTCVFSLLAFQRSRVWDSELTLWADAAAKAPAMLRPHLRLGDALARAGRTAEAEAAYLQALDLREWHPAVRNNLGLLYQREGRQTEAEAQYRALLAVSPDNQPARMNLAEMLLRSGRVGEAETEYRLALQHGSTGGRAQLRLGQIALRHGGDPATALDRLDAAAAAGLAGDADVHIGRGVALRGLGRTAAALTAYRRALQLEPRRSDAWYNIGNLLAEQGQPQDAAQAWRRVIDIGDDSTLVRQAGERLRKVAPLNGANPN